MAVTGYRPPCELPAIARERRYSDALLRIPEPDFHGLFRRGVFLSKKFNYFSMAAQPFSQWMSYVGH